MYDPTIARFLQEDTYTGDKNDPLSLNLYAYCMYNPLKYSYPTGHFWSELWNGAKEVASDIVESVDSTVDSVVNYIDTKVEEAFTFINGLIDEGFNYVESTFDISDSTPIYGEMKAKYKQGVGFVEGAFEEAISMVTGIASLVAKNNNVIIPIRTFNNISNVISDPDSFKDKVNTVFDTVKTINDIGNHLEQLFTNPTAINAAISINNYGNELKADPYKRGNLVGHVTVFVASFFIGVGEAKTASSVSKVEEGINATSKAEETINEFSKVETSLNNGGEAGKILWANWNDYEKVTVTRDGVEQTYAKIGDRLYSKHAVDRMQPSGNRYGRRIEQASGDYGRSVAPQYIEDVLNSTIPMPQENGNLSFTSGSLQVITNTQGNVVTIITK